MLRRVPGIDANVIADSTAIPVGTDVVLFGKITSVFIDVRKSDAIIETGAAAMATGGCTMRCKHTGLDLREIRSKTCRQKARK